VRNKKIVSILLLICLVLPFTFLLASTGCAKRGMVEPDYSASAAEGILLAINKSDYDSISAYFNTEFKDALKKMVDAKALALESEVGLLRDEVKSLKFVVNGAEPNIAQNKIRL